MPNLPPVSALQIEFALGSGIPGINPYSARGVHQTLDWIEAVQGNKVFRRTVNGTLIDISPHQMRKYRSEISCSDQAPPAIDGVPTGTIVVVSCVAELSFQTGTEIPSRPIVAGSERTEGAYTYYNPVLTMMVLSSPVEFDEWGAVIGWKLALEEV